MKPSRVVLLALLAVACDPESGARGTQDAGETADAGQATRPLDPATHDALDRATLEAALGRGEAQNVLIVLDDGATSGSSVRTIGLTSPRARVLAQLAPADVLFVGEALPFVGARIRDVATLTALDHTAGVVRVEPEHWLTGNVVPSLTLIHQPDALARGDDGRGLSVAVLDTGADFTTPELGACSAPGDSCVVSYAQDFAPDDHVADDAVRHGTNVSTIVHAVAPSAHILALDVFNGTSGSSIDITAALDWVVAHRAQYAIVAVNMSLGYGGFTAPCPSEALAVALQRVRDAGIVAAVATGNSGYTNAISSPACAPSAVSVGAVDNTGVVASFSNSASFATLLAPGVGIAGGGVVMSGTSQATPHVAGSFAALRTAYPSDAVTDAIARLVGTGVHTTDARNAIVLPRIDLGAATAGGATAPPPDVAAPTGTLTLPTWSTSTAAHFTIAASDASGIASMCLTTAATCTTFVAFASTGTVTVPSGDGIKMVRAWLRDSVGNTTSAALVATTTLDATRPTTGALTAHAGIGRVTLNIGTSTDTGSGIAGYRVVYATGTASPTTCATGTALPDTTSTTIVHDGLTNGTTYRYRVCALDRAGNVGTGAVASAMPVAELDAPTGTVVIASGAVWTRTTSVSLALTATDASTVSSMCLSSTTTCTSWRTFASPTTFALTSGSGARTVYAWFRDQWGNASTTPASDSIQLDTTAPTVPTVVAAAITGGVTLTITGSSDAGSGLSHFVVASAHTTAPSSCATATSVTEASPRIASITGTGAIGWRVCAVDVAGNVGAGASGVTTAH